MAARRTRLGRRVRNPAVSHLGLADQHLRVWAGRLMYGGPVHTAPALAVTVACRLHMGEIDCLVGGRIVFYIVTWLLGVPLGLIVLFWLLGIFS